MPSDRHPRSRRHPATGTAVAILDRDSWDGDTDNLVVVDPDARLVLFIPRDLWCPQLGDRVNAAWRLGGAAGLKAALAEHGVTIDGGLCLRRSASVRFLERVSVTVPVDRPLVFRYPLAPEERLRDGAKLVRFDPPRELLEGERLHQWLGARSLPDRHGSDLSRIPRQVILLRRLVEEGAPFAEMLDNGELLRSWGDGVIDTLRGVGPDWTFEILGGVHDALIDGKMVLVRDPSPAPVRLARAPLRRLRWGRARAMTARRRLRLIAVLAVRDEAAHLPSWLTNVAAQVDAIVALDDGSRDGSAEILRSHSSVAEVLANPIDRPRWDEVGNHHALVACALRHGAEWIVALDADERLERRFRDRVERAIRRGRARGIEAFALPVLDLWDSPHAFRVDGHWGSRRVPRLFRARADHDFDERPLHAAKAPLQARRRGEFPKAGARIYHLGMLSREDRTARRARYEALDPDRHWQPIGYAHLTDETGLRLRRVRALRAFAPLPGDGPATRPR
ncbi:unannotated protein [freshwater metagenome]|uniref:Unannotated protein n=1 Tax=freshwater metagenome TaxID=449393 RepID=A0A6J7H415_9ZZZZ|nr:glycosyltransferase [Actinomycetota bacterium]